LIGQFFPMRGQASGTHSFDPIVIVAGLIPFIGMILVLLLVRNTRRSRPRAGTSNMNNRLGSAHCAFPEALQKDLTVLAVAKTLSCRRRGS